MSTNLDSKLNSRVRSPVTTVAFMLLILTVFASACGGGPDTTPTAPPENAQAFSDRNARMYQMHYDSSADPASNVLQSRRFIGHLHMADLEAIFGDLQALPLDSTCNHAAGPVQADGHTWWLTATPDLVGVNLISLAPDGTRSSAFDLDGDRVVDLLDVRLGDNRRYSIFTEDLGMDVFRTWLQGLNPFCSPEVIQQLGLPDLGCDELGQGPAGGPGGSFAGSGIIDYLDMLCSEYETGPMAGLLARSPNRAGTGRVEYSQVSQTAGGRQVIQETFDYFNESGEFDYTVRFTTFTDFSENSTGAVVEIVEIVYATGDGSRTVTSYYDDGSTNISWTEPFRVSEQDRGKSNYDGNATRPPPPDGYPAPESSSADEDSTQGNTSSEGFVPDNESTGQGNESPNEGNPGPEGSDLGFEQMCRERANNQSGIEQAVSQNPAAINLSCGDLVGAPSSGNCSIITWARPTDFLGVLEPPENDQGCDPLNDPERRCEGASFHDMIRRVRGRTAELWSLDIPSVHLCPPLLCDPAQAAEVQSYTAGGIQVACPVVEEPPTLEPSEATCPPGTYYAPVTNRCIAIQIPEAGNDEAGNDGSGACNLTTAVCTNQGLSFDANKCECVPIQ